MEKKLTVNPNKATQTSAESADFKPPVLEEDPSTEEHFVEESVKGSEDTSKSSVSQQVNKQETKMKLYYRIGEVAKALSIEKHVIRYWEKEFEIDTHRSSSGQRLYRKKEITRLQKIKSLIYDEGYTIQGAKKFLNPTSGEQIFDKESYVKQNANFRNVLREIKRELQDIQSITKSL